MSVVMNEKHNEEILNYTDDKTESDDENKVSVSTNKAVKKER